MHASNISPDDVNLLASFLANQQAHDLPDAIRKSGAPKPILIICGSAIFHCFESVYRDLWNHPTALHTLLLVGGVGHSTPFLYEAVKQDPRFRGMHNWLITDQVSEARFMYQVLEDLHLIPLLERGGVQILREEQSTNCGANAIEAMKVLQEAGVPEDLSITIVQDPTMSLRTLASFEKVLEGRSEGQRPRLQCMPTFVPRVKLEHDRLVFDADHMPTENIWDMERFLDLLLGEIPRLRDDENGYGPKGKGFIPHVEIPDEVEKAWARLKAVIETLR